MKFEAALIELRKGKKIRHSFFKEGEFLDIYNIVTNHILGATLLCEQWSILEEPAKTFPEVFEAFKDGRQIRRRSWGKDSKMHNKQPDDYAIYYRDLLASDWEIMD